MGMYVNWRLSVNLHHSMCFVCGGVVLYLFCRPIRAMSLLKYPHKMCMWLGCVVVCCAIFC